jgi:uncharacterized protein
MKVILDTSALVASLAKKSPFRPIFDAVLRGQIELIVSNDILHEYEEIIAQKTSPSVALNVIELLGTLPNVHFQAIHFYWQLIEIDPDDNKFVDCFIAAGADYLVSNDKHFRTASKEGFPPVTVIGTVEFLNLLQD